MEAWYLDDSADDQRKPHKQQPNVAVTLKELQRYGILYWKLDADKYEEDPELQKIRKERNYSWMDIVNIDKDTLPNYEEKLVISYLKLDGKRHSHLAGCLSVKMTIWRHDAGDPAARVDEIRSFFQEHIHLDEEIRYILNGSGYFDVRDKDDKWIRIAMTKGDMITLPAGIYHRFTLDENNYVKAMRLFVGEPVWIPYYRPADELEVRKKYVQFLNQKL